MIVVCFFIILYDQYPYQLDILLLLLIELTAHKKVNRYIDFVGSLF